MVNNPLGINPEPMKTVPGCVWCRLRACADDCPGKYGETFVTVTRETKKTFVRSVHTEECVSPSYMLGVKASTNLNLLARGSRRTFCLPSTPACPTHDSPA